MPQNWISPVLVDGCLAEHLSQCGRPLGEAATLLNIRTVRIVHQSDREDEWMAISEASYGWEHFRSSCARWKAEATNMLSTFVEFWGSSDLRLSRGLWSSVWAAVRGFSSKITRFSRIMPSVDIFSFSERHMKCILGFFFLHVGQKS